MEMAMGSRTRGWASTLRHSGWSLAAVLMLGSPALPAQVLGSKAGPANVSDTDTAEQTVAGRPTPQVGGGGLTPSGGISAFPSVCNIDELTGLCASTIAWDTVDATKLPEVWVNFHSSGAYMGFSSGFTNSALAPWIDAAGMRFDLLTGGILLDSVEVIGNPGPSVSLTSPINGATISAPLTLTASASDANGVAKVEFFDGATLIGNAPLTPPNFSISWANPTSGSHTLTARATDSKGAFRTSAPVTVTVGPAYIVRLTPTNKTVTSSVISPNTASATFRLASAGKIRFQTSVGGAYVEQSPTNEWMDPESTTEGFNYQVYASLVSGVPPNAGAGLNTWVGMGTSPIDWVLMRSISGASQSVINIQIRRVGTTTVLASTNVTLTASVTNPPPTVSLTAPANGTVYVNAPASIPLSAVASDSNGAISLVQFFNGGVSLPNTAQYPNPDVSAPYAYTWSNVAPGTYSLTAKATDNDGAITTSTSSVTVIVNAPPSVGMSTPPPQSGSACAFALSASSSDSDGTISKVEFFNGGVALTGTTQNPNPDTTAPYSFTWSSVPPGSYTLTARATDNRGAVTTSAPVTAFCGAMPTATITAPTNGGGVDRPAIITLVATATAGSGTVTQVEFFDNGVSIGSDPTPDVGGNYSVPWDTANRAAGIHNLTARATNSLNTVGAPSPTVVITVHDPNPTVTLSVPGASFQELVDVPLTADATIPFGTITQVEFFSGATSVGIGAAISGTSTFTFNWTKATGATVGNHSLTAKATSSLLTTATSSPPVSITITNVLPAISFTAPSDGATFTTADTVTLIAAASDVNGTITKVEFFDGATLLNAPPATVSPYSFPWSTAALGTHALTARATDNLGAVSTTPVITITVVAPGPTMCFVLPLAPGSLP